MLAHSPSQSRFSCLPAILHDVSEERQCQVSAVSSICKHYCGSEGQRRTHGEVRALNFWKRLGDNCVGTAERGEEPCEILYDDPERVLRPV